jgi:hypothetical protein
MSSNDCQEEDEIPVKEEIRIEPFQNFTVDVEPMKLDHLNSEEIRE